MVCVVVLCYCVLLSIVFVWVVCLGVVVILLNVMCGLWIVLLFVMNVNVVYMVEMLELKCFDSL